MEKGQATLFSGLPTSRGQTESELIRQFSDVMQQMNELSERVRLLELIILDNVDNTSAEKVVFNNERRYLSGTSR